MRFEPVRMGIVGVGSFGQLHAATLAGLAEAELVALVDANEQAIVAAGRYAPGAATFHDLREAVAKSDAEAWVVATRTASHVPIAKELLAAGKAVLIEKPLAPDIATARQLMPLVAEDSSNLMLGHIVLFAPEFRSLLQQIALHGPMRYFHATRHRSALHRTEFPEETPLSLTMVHDLYLALVMTGCETPSYLSAELHAHPEGGYDLALAKFEWPGGIWGAFTASFLTPTGMANDGFDRLEVFGEGWAAEVRLNPRPIQIWTDRAQWPLTLDIHADPQSPTGWLAEQLRHFCRVVRKVAEVPLGARYEDALVLQDWLERLEQSAKERTC